MNHDCTWKGNACRAKSCADKECGGDCSQGDMLGRCGHSGDCFEGLVRCEKRCTSLMSLKGCNENRYCTWTAGHKSENATNIGKCKDDCTAIKSPDVCDKRTESCTWSGTSCKDDTCADKQCGELCDSKSR